MTTSNEKTFASLIHLSTLSQYFIPLGNYIFPIILWSTKKKESEFIDYNGKQTLNFQLSILLYSLVLLFISVPILIFTIFKNLPIDKIINNQHYEFENLDFNNISGTVLIAILSCVLFGIIQIIKFILIIYAAVKASNGEEYKYPLSIPFFK